MVRAARAAGLDDVGENYVEELTEKRAATPDVQVVWHYLGALQTNKIAQVTKVADVLCGVSRLKELDKIASHRPGMRCTCRWTTPLRRAQRSAPGDVASLVSRARALDLDVRGLMTVAPVDPELARRAFVATDLLASDSTGGTVDGHD